MHLIDRMTKRYNYKLMMNLYHIELGIKDPTCQIRTSNLRMAKGLSPLVLRSTN